MTLIEILVSLVISTTILLAAYTVYAAATEGWNTSRRRMDMHQRARVSLDLIARCLRSTNVTDDQQTFVFEAENVEVEPEEGIASGEEILPAQDLLAFRTNAPLYLPGDQMAPDQSKIQFFLEVPQPDAEDAEEQPLSLKMKLDPNLEEDTTETGYIIEISEGVDELNFHFFNGTTWEDQWTSTQGVPRAVEVTIVVRDMEGKNDPQAFSRLCPIECWREVELTTITPQSSDQTQSQSENRGSNNSGGSGSGGRNNNRSGGNNNSNSGQNQSQQEGNGDSSRGSSAQGRSSGR